MFEQSARGGRNEAAEKRNGATFKLYAVREEFSWGLTTTHMYERGKMYLPGNETFKNA